MNTRLAMAVSATLVQVVGAQTAWALHDACSDFEPPQETRAYALTGPSFLCEAPPCFNMLITDVETGETTEIAHVFACPADPADRETLAAHVDLDFDVTVSVIGYPATWDGFGPTAAVFVATGIGPDLP